MQVSEALGEARGQLGRVVAVLQELGAAGAQTVAPLGESEGLSALSLEEVTLKAVQQVHCVRTYVCVCASVFPPRT